MIHVYIWVRNEIHVKVSENLTVASNVVVL